MVIDCVAKVAVRSVGRIPEVPALNNRFTGENPPQREGNPEVEGGEGVQNVHAVSKLRQIKIL